MDVKWYCNGVLICIFLMISGIKYLFIYLLAICVSYSVKCGILNILLLEKNCCGYKELETLMKS